MSEIDDRLSALSIALPEPFAARDLDRVESSARALEMVNVAPGFDAMPAVRP